MGRWYQLPHTDSLLNKMTCALLDVGVDTKALDAGTIWPPSQIASKASVIVEVWICMYYKATRSYKARGPVTKA